MYTYVTINMGQTQNFGTKSVLREVCQNNTSTGHKAEIKGNLVQNSTLITLKALTGLTKLHLFSNPNSVSINSINFVLKPVVLRYYRSHERNTFRV